MCESAAFNNIPFKEGRDRLMQFRNLGDSKYFPPVVPDGSLFGYAPGVDASGSPVHLMEISGRGLQLNGLFIEWNSIDGVSLDGAVMTLHTQSFLSGGFRYGTGGMLYRRDKYSEYEHSIQGYEVCHALMNRITFELQKAESEINLF